MTGISASIDVSAVVVNWNVASLLDDCLGSISREARASELDVEIIVVDNASAEQDFRQVVAKHRVTRLVEMDENRGYGAACNAGIEASHGNAVFLLNPDTILQTGCLASLWETLYMASHIGLVAPLLLNPDGTVQSMGYRFPGWVNVLFDLVPVPERLYASSLNGRVPPGNGVLPLKIDYALGAALFARRSALDQIGGFDEAFHMYSEEVDMQRRLADHGWTCLLDPAARVTHIGGQSTAQQASAMQYALWDSRIDYFERWSTGRQRRMIALAARLGTRISDVWNPGRRELNGHIRSKAISRLSSRQ